MNPISVYTPAYNFGIKIALYEFETKEEAQECINSPLRETCFMSSGKCYVGLRVVKEKPAPADTGTSK